MSFLFSRATVEIRNTRDRVHMTTISEPIYQFQKDVRLYCCTYLDLHPHALLFLAASLMRTLYHGRMASAATRALLMGQRWRCCDTRLRSWRRRRCLGSGAACDSSAPSSHRIVADGQRLKCRGAGVVKNIKNINLTQVKVIRLTLRSFNDSLMNGYWFKNITCLFTDIPQAHQPRLVFVN